METVTSPDGTTIAYERTGSGAPLVLVHGSAGDHTRWGRVQPLLDDHFTVHAMDRRGRGKSGDGATYAFAREAEDIAHLVDSLTGPAVVYGHSFGALCSLEAALLCENLDKLVLYEPPFPPGDHELYRAGVETELDGLLEKGDREAALVLFLREIAQMAPAEIDGLRAAPNWPGRVQAAHTLARELKAEMGFRFDATRFRHVHTPTLLLLGSESQDVIQDATEAVAKALPNSRIAVLAGPAHIADVTAPDMVVREILSFARSPT